MFLQLELFLVLHILQMKMQKQIVLHLIFLYFLDFQITFYYSKNQQNQKQLEILGDGKQVKSYIHVDDCINAILFCVENSKNQIDVFNIGNRDQIDVSSIGSIVCKSLGLENVEICTKGGTKDGRGWIGDIKNMQLDISKVTNLGWSPKLDSKLSVEKAAKEIINENKYQSP